MSSARTPIRTQLVPGGLGHGDVLAAGEGPARDLRLDRPADPAREPGIDDRPLLSVDVVDQHDHWCAAGQPGEEGDSVLHVDEYVDVTERPSKRQPPAAGVDGELVATTDEPYAVLDFVRRRLVVRRADDRDAVAECHQPAGDVLDEDLRAAALGVGGVSPVHEDDMPRRLRHRDTPLLPWTTRTLPTSSKRVRRFGMSDIVVRCRRPLTSRLRGVRRCGDRSSCFGPSWSSRPIRRTVLRCARTRCRRHIVATYTDLRRRARARRRRRSGLLRRCVRERRCDLPMRSTPTSARWRWWLSPRPGSVLGSGMALPFADGSASTSATRPTCSSTCADPWLMADEMVRVTRPGGLVFISYTTWYGPWGGHETAPWHFLGGRVRRPALRPQARQAAQERLRVDRCSR